MRGNHQIIAKNAFVLFLSQMITWGLALTMNLLIPRYLGSSGIGQMAIAGAFLAIITEFVVFGSEIYIIKEIASNRNRTPELVGTALTMRFAFMILGYLALLTYLWVVDYPASTIVIIAIYMISSPIWWAASVFGAAMRGLEVMEHVSIADVASKVVNLLLTIGAILAGLNIYFIASINVVTALIGLAIQYTAYRRMYSIEFIGGAKAIIAMVRGSAPFLVGSFLMSACFRIDVIIIGSLVDEQMLGWYSVVSTLFGSLLFIPTVLGTAVFPSLVRAHVSAKEGDLKILAKSVDLMFLGGIPIGLGVVAVANQLVVLLYGADFAQAGPILMVMGCVVILTYIASVTGQYVTASNRINTWTLFWGLVAAITIPLDLMLVPWCQATFGNGAIGGALSFLVTEFIMAVVGIFLIPRGTLSWQNVRVAAGSLLAGVLMLAVVWTIRDMFLVVPVIVGAVVYIGMIAALRLVPRSDLNMIIAYGQVLLTRLRIRAPKPEPTVES